MSVTADLLDGVAAMLLGAGLVTWRTDGSVYVAGETALTFKDLPPDPDRVVCLAAFGANNDNPKLPLGNQPLQVRLRGTADPLDVENLGDAVFAVLHGATNLVFGACHVIQILRTSSIPLGMDQQSRRWERSDNYALDVDYPTSTNRPT